MSHEGGARHRLCGMKALGSQPPLAHPLLISRRRKTMNEQLKRKIFRILIPASLLMLQATVAFAEANAESDLDSFLRGIGDFLIRTVGPGVLVIGIAVAGVSMALGDERGMQRGALAAGGGALIMLARAVLDFIQSITHF
jgi:type IV secretory pathway VirB2 component (pilin)